MDKQDIIGFYKNYTLVKQDEDFYVVRRDTKTVVFKGNEEAASKVFIMLATKFIDEELNKIES